MTDLYERAAGDDDLTTALAAQKEINKLLGLYSVAAGPAAKASSKPPAAEADRKGEEADTVEPAPLPGLRIVG